MASVFAELQLALHMANNLPRLLLVISSEISGI